MPYRREPLVENKIYHVFNRCIQKETAFDKSIERRRAVETIAYYRNSNPHSKFSLNRINRKHSKVAGEKQIQIIAYCIMPTHFHFLVKQLTDDGISKTLSKFTNSYTKFFNKKHNRYGPLFQGRFNAIPVESDEQLLHVSRYIHLNPFSSNVVKTVDELIEYPYSSLPEYLKTNKVQKNICAKSIILKQFNNIDAYKNFVLQNAEHQRELEKLKKRGFKL